MPARTIAALTSALLATTVMAEETPKLGKAIPILSGDDLSGCYAWTEATGLEDARGFATVKDGVLRIADESMGYVATEAEYENYHLTFDFKWGELRKPSKYVRNSGLLLHGHGPDGAANKRWISSVECQLAQGCEGDFILIRGKGSDSTLSAHVRIGEDKRPRWNPKHGKLTKYSGRQFWWNDHQVGFKELIDTRGKNDRASPLGEWTKVEAMCDGDKITINVNGHTVNEAVSVSPAKGKIAFQGEGYEVFFRNIELRELKQE